MRSVGTTGFVGVTVERVAVHIRLHIAIHRGLRTEAAVPFTTHAPTKKSRG
ncbi:hypothetical protein M3181_03240 [Mesobacillus maritimus]|uniref:hypothetical protein n=1 Tax=Mesobacillus maritimus TaxID=1643336 RepID=UPI00203ED8DF|nr:hypothetical protein [Mesobacillus maritimus]MCM3668016.1 hypothetical protein [Mesobacillus maritimus]